MSMNIDLLLKELLSLSMYKSSINHLFRRLSQRQIEEACVVSLLLDKAAPSDVDDACPWGKGVGRYTVIEMFVAFFAARAVRDNLGILNYPSSWMWNKMVTTKVGFFCWYVSRSVGLTRDYHVQRGWIMPNSFPQCGNTDESVHHLFLGCVFLR
ncbi:hypothetical protein ACHQM5_001421 [Ranunculus cassubicifolius]